MRKRRQEREREKRRNGGERKAIVQKLRTKLEKYERGKYTGKKNNSNNKLN